MAIIRGSYINSLFMQSEHVCILRFIVEFKFGIELYLMGAMEQLRQFTVSKKHYNNP